MSKKNKPVIWALYDDGNGSWNQLGKDNVFSIGINDNPTWKNYFKVDLSTTNLNIINDLEKVAKITGRPDFIVAHPPCESWSIADNQRRLYRGIKKYHTEDSSGVLIDLYDWSRIDILNNTCIMKNKKHLLRHPAKQIGRCLIGMGTATALKCILEHFNPLIMIIENPQTSKIWDFLYCMCDILGYRQLTYYNKWDSEYTPKPTTFMFKHSGPYNWKMITKEAMIRFPEEVCKYTPNKKTLTFGRSGTVSLNYDQKSSVPKKLIEWLYNAMCEKWEVYREVVRIEEQNV